MFVWSLVDYLVCLIRTTYTRFARPTNPPSQPKNVRSATPDAEKYGRILADVDHHGRDMGQWMIQQHLAKPYDGGTKAKWAPADDADDA